MYFRWSLIAGRIPGRTDNEVKNYWNNHLRKKFNPIKGFTRNARAVGGKQPGFEQVARAKKICGGTVNPLCMNGKGSSFSPYKDASSTVHAVKDENSGSASWDIREIVNILMGDEDRCNRTEYVAIEDFKQSIDGFHDDMDLNTSIINHNHTAWPHGNNHESSMPIIYSPDFQTCKTCPSDCMARGGLYQQYSMSASFSSMGQQGYKIFSATINSEEKPTGDVSNLQPKTIAEAQIQTHIPPYELIQEDDFRDIDCDVFDQFSINIASPELGEYMSLKSCLQPQDPTANQCSETWLSSFNWFDCIQQLEY